jgi:hypothetical protein
MICPLFDGFLIRAPEPEYSDMFIEEARKDYNRP